MPLPLTNLDTRRWADLVEEARMLIPRYAPAWTDHNLHDPGISIVELLAWLVEQDLYRANRVPERHRRKFLGLLGMAPYPPQPAQVALTFELVQGQAALELPQGLALATGGAAAGLPFRTTSPLTVVPARLQAVQSFDGATYADQTRLWRDRLPLYALGADPQVVAGLAPHEQPALYLGFDAPLPQDAPASMWLDVAGGRTGAEERARIIADACDPAHDCRPNRTCRSTARTCGCSDAEPDIADEPAASSTTDMVPAHHAVRITWEYLAPEGWRAFAPRPHAALPQPGEVVDETRGLTLDGALRVWLPGPMRRAQLGASDAECFYLRGRMQAGPPDAAPQLRTIALNTVTAEQVRPARGAFIIARGVIPVTGREPAIGRRGGLTLQLDAGGSIVGLAFGNDISGPDVVVLDYRPASAAATGRLDVTLALADFGTGQPGQQIDLPDAPIANGQIRIWTTTGPSAQAWRQQPDLDASTRRDADFALDAQRGTLRFGDGERGRVVPAGAAVLATYQATAGARGNVEANTPWRLAGADDALNRALLRGMAVSDSADVARRLALIANYAAAERGAGAEELDSAAGRAAEIVWAHERLLELCPAGDPTTLDQLDPRDVLQRSTPPRAATLLDFERLALDVPGTHVARARAWAGFDPAYPCLSASGTVTVVILPALPRRRPAPSRGLLRAVWRYLDRRRVIGTRLRVVGPNYLEVRVQARVKARAGVAPQRLHADLVARLDSFLDPLHGGPHGRGWPFGRDVYRAEVMQQLGGAPGVDQVLALELASDAGDASCGNLCVGPTWLVTPGSHVIEIVSGGQVWITQAGDRGCASTTGSC